MKKWTRFFYQPCLPIGKNGEHVTGGKEHIGYIIDRVGFEEYKKWALEDVELMPETIVKQCVYWSGIHFDR